MRRLIGPVWVIARRDYVATVFSRAFLLFLLGPLLPAIFGAAFGELSARDDAQPSAPPILIAGPAADTQAILAARGRIAARLGDDWMPPLRADGGHGRPEDVMLLGGFAKPVLSGPADAVAHLKGPATLLLEEARGPHAAVHLAVRAVGAPPPDAAHDARRTLARGAQFALFVLVMILAGMLISNLVEEKSSKVIEVLAAAVPIDAVFAGKLVGMLGVSLTGLAIWGATAGVAALALLPHGSLGVPAVGWPLFVALGLVDFVMIYLLVGALYLGVGAQAGTVREVQTLSLPLTMTQLAFFGIASTSVGHPGGALGIAAAIVPWSSPFAMIGQAALSPALWPHAVAFAWQASCFAGIVYVAARLFRRTVLRSGGGRSSR